MNAIDGRAARPSGTKTGAYAGPIYGPSWNSDLRRLPFPHAGAARPLTVEQQRRSREHARMEDRYMQAVLHHTPAAPVRRLKCFQVVPASPLRQPKMQSQWAKLSRAQQEEFEAQEAEKREARETLEAEAAAAAAVSRCGFEIAEAELARQKAAQKAEKVRKSRT